MLRISSRCISGRTTISTRGYGPLLHVPRLRSVSTTSSGPPRSSAPYLSAALLGAGIGIGYFASTFSSPGASSPAKEAYPNLGTPADYTSCIVALTAAFAHREGVISTDEEDLRIHGCSSHDFHHGDMPHGVVAYPESTEDVVAIVKIATQYRMPITPYSGATNLEGHTRGHSTAGICIDVSGMNRIIAIHEADSDIVCQPGVGWVQVNDALKEKGIPLFFPLDPAPGATIGGMLSTGCSGTNAVRYGTAKGEWFLNATVVLPNGEVIKTRQRSRKSSAGFDVTKLFIGAEGTLGIVTEVTIRLAPVIPTTVAVVQFPDVRKATEAVIDILNQGVGIQCIELVDNVFMSAVNNFGQSTRTWPELDSLFIKIQGPTPASLQETSRIIQSVASRHGSTSFALARSEREATDLWADRKNAHYSGLSLVENAKGWPTDVCVPISALPKLVLDTKKELAEAGLVSPIVGHAGDGNFHAHILYVTEEEHDRAKVLVDSMVKRAIALGGTCTGEHGVGIGKRKYLKDELGPGTVELMKTIKRAVDPLGLFNPGKLYPDDDDDAEVANTK